MVPGGKKEKKERKDRKKKRRRSGGCSWPLEAFKDRKSPGVDAAPARKATETPNFGSAAHKAPKTTKSALQKCWRWDTLKPSALS